MYTDYWDEDDTENYSHCKYHESSNDDVLAVNLFFQEKSDERQHRADGCNTVNRPSNDVRVIQLFDLDILNGCGKKEPNQ